MDFRVTWTWSGVFFIIILNFIARNSYSYLPDALNFSFCAFSCGGNLFFLSFCRNEIYNSITCAICMKKCLVETQYVWWCSSFFRDFLAFYLSLFVACLLKSKPSPHCLKFYLRVVMVFLTHDMFIPRIQFWGLGIVSLPLKSGTLLMLHRFPYCHSRHFGIKYCSSSEGLYLQYQSLQNQKKSWLVFVLMDSAIAEVECHFTQE